MSSASQPILNRFPRSSRRPLVAPRVLASSPYRAGTAKPFEVLRFLLSKLPFDALAAEIFVRHPTAPFVDVILQHGPPRVLPLKREGIDPNVTGKNGDNLFHALATIAPGIGQLQGPNQVVASMRAAGVNANQLCVPCLAPF